MQQQTQRQTLRMLGGMLVLWTAVFATDASGALRDAHETPQPAWRDVGGDARYQIEMSRRIVDRPHSGQACEYWQYQSGDGTAIYLSYDIGRAPVIDETSAGVWLRAEKAGIQMLARIVFPRTLDPNSQQPITALVAGAVYGRPGEWERLSVVDFTKQVEQQARVLRAQLRLPVDTAQAYVDRVLLNVYVGPGKHRLWLDDLEVTGVTTAPGTPPAEMLPLVDAGQGNLTPISRRTTDGATTPDAQPAVQVELKGQSLLVRGKQFFPRMIEYQGEPLEFLKQVGFNSVRMRTTPSRQTLDEAAKLGLWIVCPPPQPPDLQNPYGAATPPEAAEFGPWFAPVLAWNLGDGLTNESVDVLKRWAEFVRRSDLPRPRPLVCGAVADLRSLSRQVDIVSMRKPLLGTNFELAQYGDWLRERSRFARPGTPLWTMIQTQPVREVMQQAQLLSLSSPPVTPVVEAEQIRLMVFEALSAGSRGLHFDSQTPLNGTDQASRTRAAGLQLINLELDLIDVWAASGVFVSRVAGSEKDISAALMQIDRGHLLLPMWTGGAAQFVPGQSAGSGITFVVPGVPETVEVFEISPGGMRPLPRQRVTGGVRITLDEFSLTSIVLLTQDPHVIGVVGGRLDTVGRRAVQLQRDVSEAKLQMAERLQSELFSLAPPVPKAPDWLRQSRQSLQIGDQRLAEGNLRDGYLEMRRVLRPIALLERAHWKNAVDAAGAPNFNLVPNAPTNPLPTATPFTSSFATLAEHWRMLGRLRGINNWGNLVPGGEFESLDLILQNGWRHVQHPQEGIRAAADLAPGNRPLEQPGAGQFSLHLAAYPLTEQSVGSLVESAPVWITSPAVNVTAGQVLRISGWVYVPKPIAGNRDGLIVFDSIGGDVLAERFTETKGWKKFVYYRMAPLDGTFSITAALTGFGDAFVDDLMIETAR
jgi:hypothetical protein